MHIGFRLFSLIATLLFSLHLAAQENLYQRWDGKSSRQLIDLGNQYFFAEKQQPDSALVCFSLVENRLGKASGREEREELCEAYMGLWMVYFFSYFDYSKSMDYLGKSNKLAEGLPELLPRVLLNYGNMYQTMGSQWADDNLNRKAADCFYKAFHAAVRVKLYDVADLAFANVIAVEWSLGQFAVVEKMYPKYLEYSAGRKETVDSRYTKLLYQGYKQLSHKQPLRAVETFKRQLPIVSTGVEYLRLLFNAHENIALAYASAGDYGSAVANMRKAEALARRYDLKDGKLEVYSYLRQYLRKGGWTAEAEAYQRRYYQLKDSLQNYQQVMGVSKLEFLGKIEDARQELEEMQQRQRVSMVLLVVALCVAGVVAVSLTVVYRKNRQLSAANKVLYKKNIEVREKEDKLLQIQKTASQTEEAMDKNHTSAEINSPQKNEKFTEEEKTKLMDRFINVMVGCKEIYSYEFTVARLAELAGSNSKTASKIIKEKTGGNFNTFLNDYRIREACRRINCHDYKNYSIGQLCWV